MRYNEINVTLFESQFLKEIVYDKSKTTHLCVFINMKVDCFHLAFLSDQISGALETEESKPYGHRKQDHLVYSPASPRLQCHSQQIAHSWILKNLVVRLHGCFRQPLQMLHDPHSYSTSQRGQGMVFSCQKCSQDVVGCPQPAPKLTASCSFTLPSGKEREQQE